MNQSPFVELLNPSGGRVGGARAFVWKIESLLPGRVKQVTYEIYTYCLPLSINIKDWLAQCQDDITKWKYWAMVLAV